MQDPGGASPPTGRGDISFPPYRLDLRAGFLRAGERAISLRPKTWAVLCYLAERPGVLVTKDELLGAVWGGVSVTEATLTKSIGEIRDALHDEVRNPRFVETVHRRGFRFVSPVEAPSPPVARPAVPPLGPPAHLVARESELSRLHQFLQQAHHGTRQTVFVTGEAGIGKTTLVQAFLASVAAGPGAGATMIATGQCVRRHSGEEPLMPVLEAVGRLARGPHASRVLELLRRDAPAWLVQLPWLADARDLEEIRASVAGTTPERMLRVFAQLVDELTSDATLVLVLEDLHWADASTVDVISILAQRPEGARLLLIGTYRSAEAIVYAPAFDGMRRVLSQKRCSVEMPLGLLPPSGIEAYLAGRFGGSAPSALVQFLHGQTEGNPLFLVTAIDHLTSQGLIGGRGHGVSLRVQLEALGQHIPGSLRDLVEMQVTDLPPFDVSVLEAASVVGLEFGAQTVAGALDASVEASEEACERLVHAQRFLHASGTEAWPDGTVAGRYAFGHALYQRVLYHRIPAARHRLLHHRIAQRLERGFEGRASDIAIELATHFEQGHDPTRAIPWLESAVAAAQRRFAPREAAGLAQRALRLLERVPAGPERHQRELRLALALSAAHVAIDGFAADEATQYLTRAHDLASSIGARTEAFHVAYMLLTASLTHADAARAAGLAEELARSAEELGAPEARLITTLLSGTAALWNGRYADDTRLRDGAAADPIIVGAAVPGENLVVWSQGLESWRLWLLGRPDDALTLARAAIATARALPNPTDLAMGLALAAHVLVWRGDLDEAAMVIAEGRDLASENGLGLWRAAVGGFGAGIHLARGNAEDAARDYRQALADFRRLHVKSYSPALLAGLGTASMRLGRLSEGFAAVEEGFELVRTTLSKWHAPELWRVHGELLAARGDPAREIESSFARALEIAREQRALAFQLRTATSLARHHLTRRRRAEARAVLGPAYEAFTQGLETTDLRQARARLEELAE